MPIHTSGLEVDFSKLKGKEFAVAVSGGSDSLALLHLLLDVGFAPYITVLHFDHNLRDESAQEAEWLQSLCHKLNVKCITEKWQAPPSSGNMQQQARQARYQFFSKICRDKSLKCVLVAHTQDDMVETFMMRLARGSGLKGLSAMKAESHVQGVNIYRPLLHLTRESLQQYLHGKGQAYISDPSNENSKFLRIRMRKLKPVLKEAGLLYEHIASSALSLERADDALQFYANQVFGETVYIEGDDLYIKHEVVEKPLEIALRVLERAMLEISDDVLAPRTSKRLRLLENFKNKVKKCTLGGVVFTYHEQGYKLEKE